MGLADTVRSAAASAFTALGNLREAVVVQRKTGVAYDVTSGAVMPSGPKGSLLAVLAAYQTKELSEQILPTDLRCLFLAADLSGSPGIGDTVTRADATVWTVINVAIDPAQAVWDVQLRRQS